MAVYTQLSEVEIKQFLALYDLPPLQEAEGILSGVENTNYLITLEDGSRFILTLFERRMAEEELPFFAELMEHLALKGFPSPKPLHAKNAKIIQRIKDKPAIMVSFLFGKSTTNIQPEHMSELGAAMANMHLKNANFKYSRKNSLSVDGWKNILNKISNQADEIAPGLANELQNEMKMISDAWPKNLPSGVIHADIFPDNVFYDSHDKLTGIIDFYFACNDFYVYELAICLNSWCFEKNLEFNITKAKLMLRAYNEVRPLSDAELHALPILARGAALRFLLTRAHDWLFQVEGAIVKPKDPIEYLKKLRFHRSVKHHKEYGL